MRERIDPQARLVAALAETMTDTMWASDILQRCQQMQVAINEIRRIAISRESGER